jgi:pimeloyl-ACP methyl ester carboxylesterase
MVSALCALVPTSAALASEPDPTQYAPLDRSGPALSVPQGELDQSLACDQDLRGASQSPVLLVPGTGSSPDAEFTWNWEPALSKAGIAWCAVTLPGNAMGDIQIAGEYLVNAIRTMHERTGGRISIVGHSQGGMVPRWALRFWPDTREMVDDVIGLAPSNHGTETSKPFCATGCSPSFWQQTAGSKFLDALNSYQETFSGVSYTVVYTHTDWVVVPNLDEASGSSSLRTGDGEIRNVAIQDVCPLDVNEHLQVGTVDNVAYALAIDALGNPGPADPSRLGGDVCTQPFMPGVDPATVVTDEAAAGADLGSNIASYPHVPVEPPLACYVFATCGTAAGQAGAAGSPAGQGTSARKKGHKPRKCHRGKGKRKRGKRCGKRHGHRGGGHHRAA